LFNGIDTQPANNSFAVTIGAKQKTAPGQFSEERLEGPGLALVEAGIFLFRE